MTLLHRDPALPVDQLGEVDVHAPSAGRRDWPRLALFIGGIAFALGNLLHPLEHSNDAYEAATWQAAHLTIFFSIPLLVLGLPVLQRKLVGRVTRPLATIPVTASVIGLIGIAPGTILEAFVAPEVGHEAMTALESGGMAVVNGLMGTAYLGGTIALGWAVRRAEVGPRWVGPSLMASAAVLLGVMGATGPAAGVVIITATMVYGLALSVLAARA